MDVIRLHQIGIKNAVAALGTSVTENQIKKLFQLSDDQIYCFDGDSAGIKASQRLLKLLLTLNLDGKNISFTVLPSGMDPDTLIENVGPEKFSNFFKDYTMTIENFLIKHLSINLDMKSVSGKATFKKNFNLILHKLPQSEFKFFLNKYVGEYIYKKKHDQMLVKFEYKNFLNRPLYKILTILYHNDLKIEKKLISEFYKNKSKFEKNHGSNVFFAIDYYIKEGTSNKFKSIIDEILIDTKDSEKLLNIYTNFFKSFKKEEVLREFNEAFSVLISK
jgi:DNA primase